MKTGVVNLSKILILKRSDWNCLTFVEQLFIFYLELVPAFRYYSSRHRFCHRLLWGNRCNRG
jgi:hypothetical protein